MSVETSSVQLDSDDSWLKSLGVMCGRQSLEEGSVKVWNMKIYGRGVIPRKETRIPSRSSRSWEIYKLKTMLWTVLGRSGVVDNVARRQEIIGRSRLWVEKGKINIINR